MNQTKLKSKFCGLLISCIPLVTLALEPALRIEPDLSIIEFTGTQNGAPVSGKFTKFTGDIHFNPKNISESSVKMNIDMNSISMSFQDAVQTLKAPDWFNVQMFPQATFQSKHFKKIDDNHYAMEGDLTIRDKSLPLSIDFTLTENTPTELKLKGQTTIKRTQFGVGQGEWADTKEIQDDVKVDFNFVLRN